MGKQFLLGAAAGLLVLPAVFGTDQQSVVRRLLASPPLRAVGVISYSVFLWHVLWIHKAAEWLDRPRGGGDFWVLLPAGLALTLAWASLSYWFIERPAIEWGRRRDRLVARARHAPPPG
jgi:peptidoglycan/LPS O-acetylase OafA/YrhL